MEPACDDNEVGNQDAPTDPAFKSIETVMRTSPQLHRALDDTDPPFDAIAKTLTLFEPALFLVRFLLGAPMSTVGEDILIHPQPTRQFFIRR